MPASAAKLLDLLAVPADERDFAALGGAAAAGARHGAAGARAGVSRAMSSRKPAQARMSRHAGRQPLPSRFPRLRRRARRAWWRAREAAGVGRMVTISTRVRQLRRGARHRRALSATSSARSARIRTTPTRSSTSRADDWSRARSHPKVVAIGEAGLDYHYDNIPRDAQEQGFRTHIAAARETGLPLVIHAREADDDMARILRGGNGEGGLPGRAALLHRRAASWPRRASSSASTSRSPAS